MTTTWFGHVHAHSHYSTIDGMRPVKLMVEKAKRLSQPFCCITDHGNIGGAVDLYTSCRAAGIEPGVGVEAYLADPDHEGELDGKVERFHLGLVALNRRGYAGLVDLITKTHTRPRFSRYPRMTLQDLSEFGKDYGKDLILTSGCFFGLVQQRLVNEGPEEAARVLKAYASWFPNTFVELQNHQIDHEGTKWNDDMVADALFDIADDLGLPVLCTQDSHYLDKSEGPAHALMKRMVYSGAEDGFPGDSFHFSTAGWVKARHTPQAWAASEESMQWIASNLKLSLPELDTFKAHVPTIARKAEMKLRKLCQDALDEYLGEDATNAKFKKYVDLLNNELDVIEFVGVANYFLLVRRVIDFCEREKICVEARGSANASLVAFLMGITQVDPLIWGGSFPRFLSKDRIKPPDIDLDIEDDRREEVIAYMASEWDTMRIGTWGKLGMTVDDNGDERGSVVVTYMSYLRRKVEDDVKQLGESKGWTKKRIDEVSKVEFAKRYGHIKGLAEIKQLSESDYLALKSILNMDSVFKSYGKHAGGVLIGADDLDVYDLVPTMLIASSDTAVTQFDMDAVEQLGFLKLDLLGQSSLTVMRKCQEFMGRKNPNDFTWIPFGDAEAAKILREGRPDNGIFHFEGYSKAKGGKELGIRNVKDAIVASALYMPAAVDSGQKDRYIQARRNPRYREKLRLEAARIHPIFEEELKDTNYLVVYQEQPLDILRALGMSEPMINMAYKVLKDSGRGAAERNAERLNKIREEFDQLCAAKGIKDTDGAWHYIAGYDVYGFNKAHSNAYGIRSYRTAYLKAHYPLEFMTALLTVWAGRKTQKKDREALYAREARRIGLRLLPPDINVSGPSWTLDRTVRNGAIRRGLVSVAGIADKTAEAIHSYAPFKDIDDLATRVRINNRVMTGSKAWLANGMMGGSLAALDAAGALESLKEQNADDPPWDEG